MFRISSIHYSQSAFFLAFHAYVAGALPHDYADNLGLTTRTGHAGLTKNLKFILIAAAALTDAVIVEFVFSKRGP